MGRLLCTVVAFSIVMTASGHSTVVRAQSTTLVARWDQWLDIGVFLGMWTNLKAIDLGVAVPTERVEELDREITALVDAVGVDLTPSLREAAQQVDRGIQAKAIVDGWKDQLKTATSGNVLAFEILAFGDAFGRASAAAMIDRPLQARLEVEFLAKRVLESSSEFRSAFEGTVIGVIALNQGKALEDIFDREELAQLRMKGLTFDRNNPSKLLLDRLAVLIVTMRQELTSLPPAK